MGLAFFYSVTGVAILVLITEVSQFYVWLWRYHNFMFGYGGIAIIMDTTRRSTAYCY